MFFAAQGFSLLIVPRKGLSNPGTKSLILLRRSGRRSPFCITVLYHERQSPPAIVSDESDNHSEASRLTGRLTEAVDFVEQLRPTVFQFCYCLQSIVNVSVHFDVVVRCEASRPHVKTPGANDAECSSIKE
jgi:hypothetical protein